VKWQVGVLGLLKWNEAPSELLSSIPASTVRYPQFNHTSSKAPQQRKKACLMLAKWLLSSCDYTIELTRSIQNLKHFLF